MESLKNTFQSHKKLIQIISVPLFCSILPIVFQTKVYIIVFENIIL
jgi:hypothetical protein